MDKFLKFRALVPCFYIQGDVKMALMKNRLEELIESAVTALGIDFVGCELVQSGRSTVLRVYVDEINGIDIAAIEKVSRQVSAVLDVEEPLSGHYTLEVSSPGLDRPLFKLEDYERFIGRDLKIRLRIRSEGGRRNFTGKLLRVDGHQITLGMETGEPLAINYDEIEKANLVPEF